MKNIRIIETGIDVTPYVEELEKFKEYWQMVKGMDGIGGDRDPYGFLPLCMGIEDSPGNIKNSDLIAPTPAFFKFKLIKKFLADRNAQCHSRAAFFKLKPGGQVGQHIDDGTYYLDKDRYHFSLLGKYEYWCEGETIIVEPGTFFWFDNKKEHRAKNIVDVDRVTFVFDLRHSSQNP